MSQMLADRPQTFLANAAIASRFRFVIMTGEYTVGLATLAAKAVGVNLDTALAAGQGILVATPGSGPSVKIEAGAAFAAGALLGPDAVGRAITAAGAASYSARALQAATALGDIVECVLENGVA